MGWEIRRMIPPTDSFLNLRGTRGVGSKSLARRQIHNHSKLESNPHFLPVFTWDFKKTPALFNWHLRFTRYNWKANTVVIRIGQ